MFTAPGTAAELRHWRESRGKADAALLSGMLQGWGGNECRNGPDLRQEAARVGVVRARHAGGQYEAVRWDAPGTFQGLSTVQSRKDRTA